MTVVEVLVAARKLIEKPENWTQGDYARTKGGYPIGPDCFAASSFCALGALRCASANDGGDLHEFEAQQFLAKAARRKPTKLAEWNDVKGRKHESVLKTFDRAIELAGAAR